MQKMTSGSLSSANQHFFYDFHFFAFLSIMVLYEYHRYRINTLSPLPEVQIDIKDRLVQYR